jgi:hypothetical protein
VYRHGRLTRANSTWTTVDPIKYYNPVTSLLLKDKTEWRGAADLSVAA